MNGVYYGVSAIPSSYDSAFVLKLTKALQGSRNKTFTLNAGAGQYIFYAIPARYRECGFNVGGFDGGFTKVSTFDFTNASGYKESYYLYKSDNANLGNTTVSANSTKFLTSDILKTFMTKLKDTFALKSQLTALQKQVRQLEKTVSELETDLKSVVYYKE